jgi:hypothetical protein
MDIPVKLSHIQLAMRKSKYRELCPQQDVTVNGKGVLVKMVDNEVKEEVKKLFTLNEDFNLTVGIDDFKHLEFAIKNSYYDMDRLIVEDHKTFKIVRIKPKLIDSILYFILKRF